MSTILIVDDNEQNLYLLRTLLTSFQYETLEAAHGAEALEIARRVHPDLIISDILMPQMDGFALCREIKRDETLRDIPFVFYTATYTDARDEALAMQLGAARFIIKPVESQEFIDIVRKVLQEHAAGQLTASQPPLEEETIFYRLYNEALVRKLEDKMLDLERSHHALEESKERYRTLIENSHDLIQSVVPDGSFLFVNNSWLRTLGYSSQEAARLNVFDVIHPGSQEAFRAIFAQVMSGKSVEHQEFAFAAKDGREVLVEGNASPHIVDDKVIAMQGFFRDITERKRAEAARARSEAHLRATLYSIGDAVIAADADGRVAMMNPVAEKLTGWSEAEARGQPLELVFHIVDEETQNEVENPVKRVLREGIVIGLANHTLLIVGDGRRIPIADAGAPIRDADGKITGVVLVFRDQSAERAAQRAVQQARELAESIIATISEPLVVLDAELRVISANRAYYRFFKVTPAETEGYLIFELGNRQWDIPELRRSLDNIFLHNSQADEFEVVRDFEHIGRRTMLLSARRVNSEDSMPRMALLVFEDITGRRQRERELEAQAQLARALGETDELRPLLEHLLTAARHAIPAAEKGSVLLAGADGRLSIRALEGYSDPRLFDFAFASDSGYSARAARERKPVLIADAHADPEIRYDGEIEEARSIRSAIAAPLIIHERVIGVLSLDSTQAGVFVEEDLKLLANFAATAALIIERYNLLEETRRRVNELEAIAAVSAALRAAQTRAEMMPIILDQLTILLKAEGAAFAMRDTASGEILIEAAKGMWSSLTGSRLKPGEGISSYVIETGQPYITENIFDNHRTAYRDLLGGLPAAAGVPLVAVQHVLGALWVGRKTAFSAEEVNLLTAVGDIAANAIHRSTLHEETVRRVEQFQALQTIDRAITSSLDMVFSLDVVLQQIIAQLRADAAGVLLFDANTQQLDPVIKRGFRTQNYEGSHLRLGEALLEQTILSRGEVFIAEIDRCVPSFTRLALLKDENFVSYTAAPLIAKGEIKGLLEVFHCVSFQPDRERLDLLETIAQQAAIAIDNAQLFDNLQRSTMELSLAYETTIEGWSRALDLRDKETEGHTLRVTEMTVRLARAAGMAESELVHVRRGALLHDIGKMGVPDAILLKPGALTEDEWAIMRRHPQYAYDMLSPIAYLHPALDIPYCHHEKWDGTGYPRGLKGENIPLAARLFTVVDVWDALRSDRPYRSAWPEQEIHEYIHAQAGKHFDPQAVSLFLKALREKED